jgi:hypothetical protein
MENGFEGGLHPSVISVGGCRPICNASDGRCRVSADSRHLRMVRHSCRISGSNARGAVGATACVKVSYPNVRR